MKVVGPVGTVHLLLASMASLGIFMSIGFINRAIGQVFQDKTLCFWGISLLVCCLWRLGVKSEIVRTLVIAECWAVSLEGNLFKTVWAPFKQSTVFCNISNPRTYFYVHLTDDVARIWTHVSKVALTLGPFKWISYGTAASKKHWTSTAHVRATVP